MNNPHKRTEVGNTVRYPIIDLIASGHNIEHLCRARKIKPRDVATFMGFSSPCAVYKWQRGQALPTVDNLFALSRLLGVTMDEILIAAEEIRDGEDI